jgi:spermidine synthase
MSEYLKPCESQNFRITHHTATEDDVRRAQFIDRIHGRGEFDGFEVGTYVELQHKNHFANVMMSDTFMEKESNLDLIENAHGDVLIAGLGLGMVLMAIQKIPSISSVTVIEREQEIIDLVKPQLPLNNKVSIIQADIFTFKTKQKFDTIYFDVWDNICGDNWKDIVTLQRRFSSKLKKGGWMGSWRKEDFRDAHYRR